MPQITITATQAQYDRFLPALEAIFHRQEGETDLQFVKRWIGKNAINLVRRYESNVLVDGIVIGEIFT